MAQFKVPEMRVFDASIANDHALYDGALVKIFDEYSNWTKSSMGEVPFGIEHFRYHTQQKLAEFLGQLPDEGPSKGIALQDLSDRRILLQHLAHRFVMFWGRDIHTFRNDVQEMLMFIRNNLDLIIREKHLFIEHEGNPLRNHHKAKRVLTDAGYKAVIAMKDPDVALARFLAGPHPGIHGSPKISQYTLNILRQVQPFLTDIDDTHVESRLLDLRQKIRSRLRGVAIQTSKLQTELLSLIADDWEQKYTTEESLRALSDIEEEVETETGRPTILNEESAVVLEQCFSIPLASDTIDNVTREKLIRRRPILEHLMYTTIQKKDWEFFYNEVLPTARKYFQKLDLPLSELGHLGLILATHSRDVGIEELRDQCLI